MTNEWELKNLIIRVHPIDGKNLQRLIIRHRNSKGGIQIPIKVHIKNFQKRLDDWFEDEKKQK